MRPHPGVSADGAKVLLAGRSAFFGGQVYTVGRAAALTGVPTGILRKWEQRYGVVAPQRSPGNYRLYDDDAVRRLSVMRSPVDAGWSAQAAARHVVEDPAAAEAQLPRREATSTDGRVEELVAWSSRRCSSAGPTRTRCPVGRASALPGAAAVALAHRLRHAPARA